MRRLIVSLGLALTLIITFVSLAFASSQESFYSLPDDGTLGCERSTYLETHNRSEGIVYDSQTYFDVGQWKVGGYTIMRAGLFFDTSSIPDDATIDCVELFLYGYGDHSNIDFEIRVVSGESLSRPMSTSNYHDLSGETSVLGSMHTSEWTILGYNTIEIDSTAVNKAGVTKLALRSQRDIDSVIPSELEYVEFYMSEQKGVDKDPMLVVAYSNSHHREIATAPGGQVDGKIIIVIAGVLVVILVAFAIFRIQRRRSLERR